MPDNERISGEGKTGTDEAQGTVVLSVEGFHLAGGTQPFDTQTHRGEILGLAGLEGHGQELFLKALAGLVHPAGGRVWAHLPTGRRVVVTNAKVASRYGIAYVPRDRKTEGIFASLPVLDNFAIASFSRASVAGVLRRKVLLERYEMARSRLQIASQSPRQPITSLSGGTQQKVLLARALEMGSQVLLLNDPTRGVDVAAKQGFHNIFRSLARDSGVAIVILSTELTELVHLCDRVLVFYHNEVAGEYKGKLTEEALLSAMFGRNAAPALTNGAKEARAQ